MLAHITVETIPAMVGMFAAGGIGGAVGAVAVLVLQKGGRVGRS